MESPRSVPVPAARRSALTWAMLVLAIPVPLGIVLAFLPQLQAVGEVSHWPWEEYGFFGWWLVPLSLAAAAGVGSLRPDGARSRAVWVISAVAVLTTVALFNP